jgi:hypothetical protein
LLLINYFLMSYSPHAIFSRLNWTGESDIKCKWKSRFIILLASRLCPELRD